MTIDRFGFHKKFAVNTTFLDEVLDMEGSVDPGETWEEATIKARKRMIALVESYAPGAKPEEMKTTFSEIPTINKDFERMEIEIDNCSTKEELTAWNKRHDVLPGKILTYYTERLKILSNG